MGWSDFIRDAAILSTSYNSFKANKSLDELNTSLNDLKSRSRADFEKLTETMEKGFSMLSFELAVQSKVFKNILNVLKERRTTEADELKNFGIKALRNGWVSDAISDFKSSLELNRYDYQVYYLLSKCYFLQDDVRNQEYYLQMAFQYSVEDALFRQYVGLDIVGQLIKEKNIDEAKEIVKYLETLSDDQIELSPLLLCKIYIDLFSGIIDEQTLKNIDNAIDNYEGDDPSRIFTVLRAIGTLISEPHKSQLENRLNLKRYAISNKYSANALITTENILKVLKYLDSQRVIESALNKLPSRGDDSKVYSFLQKNFLNSAPDSVVSKYCPQYKRISEHISKVEQLQGIFSSLSINDIDTFHLIAPSLKNIEHELLLSINKMNIANQKSNFNSHPFVQNIQPSFNFKVGDDDKILVQCRLNSEEFITLTYFNLIVVDKSQKAYKFDLLNEFLSAEKNDLVIDEMPASLKSTDRITFYLRDKLSNKILLLSTSSDYSTEYGSDKKYANKLNLLWSRAVHNILLFVEFKQFNLQLERLESVVDYCKLVAGDSDKSKYDLNQNDVEFID